MFDCTIMICLVSLMFYFESVLGYGSFLNKIPNGLKVRDPCDHSRWGGVGHRFKSGGGLLNPFGEAFRNYSRTWSRTLCELDSDGDGKTNGQELGDPNCTWAQGRQIDNPPTGHPGICEPTGSELCINKNRPWFSCHQPMPLSRQKRQRRRRRRRCSSIKAKGVKPLLLRMPNTTVPAKSTSYKCVNLELPKDKEYHVIADRAVLGKARDLIHHIVVMACQMNVKPSDLSRPIGQPYDCDMIPDRRCATYMTSWTQGKPGYCHNGNVGYRIGVKGVTIVVLQLHWTNPQQRTDLTDNSGMVLYYTPNLRPNDLGSLIVGRTHFTIPPEQNNYTVEGECSSQCTSKFMTSPIFLVNGVNHMHYAGKTMQVTLIKQNGVQTITHDPEYSYDKPEIHAFENTIEVRPGDSLKATCVYDTSMKKKTTFYGAASTTHEMCYAFLMYYPAQNMRQPTCVSRWDGISSCDADRQDGVIDDCAVNAFPSSREFKTIVQELRENCSPFLCRKECMELVKGYRKRPCFRGKVKAFVESRIQTNVGFQPLVLLHSCDVEITKSETNCPEKRKRPQGRTRCLCSERPVLRWI